MCTCTDLCTCCCLPTPLTLVSGGGTPSFPLVVYQPENLRFSPGHSTPSVLLQLPSDVATGFNQRKPPHRTISVAVDSTAAFDTVSHSVLLSMIARSTLREATCRWLSNYIGEKQSVTSCRGIKSKARIVHTGVPQGSKLSPSLFCFYLVDMPRQTEPVKRIYYADDITVWTSGVKLL